MGAFADLIARQRGHLLPWVPVCLGVGIGLYFALPVEPSMASLAGLVLGAVGLAGFSRSAGETAAPLAVGMALVLFGVGHAGLRAQTVAAPVLDFRYYGPIEGRVVRLDRSLSEKPRLTLDQVVLHNTAPVRTPKHVRVSMHGAFGLPMPQTGTRVILTGHLSPPMGPAEPGGFDFRRMAWFQALGAVGYTRTPVLVLEPPAADSLALRITALRMALSEAIRAALPGQAGAFAAAVSTGDRSGLSRETLDKMRASNLAHLLAISGLHMGLLTAVVFATLRTAIALWPWLALRVDGRKWAACLAFVAAAGYLALSGGSVATQRAFIMVAVMLAALLLDRRALTLRAVAVAAILILLWRPESLTSAGFQMSFAATTALVWVFRQMRDGPLWRAPSWARPVLSLVVSSAVAGLATAPVGAAQFNMIAQYGLLANLVAVPLMGFLVMPAAVAAAALSAVGAAAPALWVMGQGCAAILWVAEQVSGLDGAVRAVVSPAPWVLPLAMGGALWGMLWQGRAKLLGFAPICVAFWLWQVAERPPVLISSTGGLIGVMGPEGRALNKPRGDRFIARAWLENDGDLRGQEAAALPEGLSWNGLRLQALTPAALRKVEEPCSAADVIVTASRETSGLPCLVLNGRVLAATGSLALWRGAEGLQVVTARTQAGQRLWTPHVKARDLAAAEAVLASEYLRGLQSLPRQAQFQE